MDGQREALADLHSGKIRFRLWASGPVWTGAENLTTNGIRSTERPGRRKFAVSTELSQSEYLNDNFIKYFTTL